MITYLVFIRNSPMALQKIIQEVHEYQRLDSTTTTYVPGKTFDPKLSDVTRSILNRMGQEDMRTNDGEKEKENETMAGDDSTYSTDDLWQEGKSHFKSIFKYFKRDYLITLF